MSSTIMSNGVPSLTDNSKEGPSLEVNSNEVPSLTALERIGPKGYLRYVFLFQLPEEYDLRKISDTLKQGYTALKQCFPVVGCEAIPDKDSKQAGVLKLQMLEEGDVEDIVVKDLQDSYFCTYPELKSKGFPVAAFDDTLCRRSVWPSPGERLPTSLVQANFIRGGLILTWCILHMVGDGTSFYTWMKVWADACLRAQSAEASDALPLQLHRAIWDDRERIMKSSGRNEGLFENHPEYTVLPVTPTSAPPKMISPHHCGQIFYFSPTALKKLKEDASPIYATEPTDQKWISTNDAVSALLWRTIMAVQSPIDTLDGDPTSTFNIAIDGRQRTDPPVHPETQGCFLEYVVTSASIRQMLSKMSLADIAISIRKAILRANSQYTDDIVTLTEKLDDVNRLIPTAFLDVPGFNCIQTSWVNFKLYDLNWGQLLGDKIDSVRSPRVGVINGLQVVLPSPPGGGMEVLVGVEDRCLERLLEDPMWLKYATPR
ncbi:transferase family-domain-containing protein [Aspergillus ambiguus]|uniref:transferase family-domain-containing protein n=1 Tax=Aspergillus ambiguus TaxID=176160 RepID=UPI003CCE3378